VYCDGIGIGVHVDFCAWTNGRTLHFGVALRPVRRVRSDPTPKQVDDGDIGARLGCYTDGARNHMSRSIET
jgi:hypothetical protein